MEFINGGFHDHDRDHDELNNYNDNGQVSRMLDKKLEQQKRKKKKRKNKSKNKRKKSKSKSNKNKISGTKTMDNLRQMNYDNFSQLYSQHCPDGQYIPAIIPAKKKIIVLGDIHGDLQLAKQMLILSGVAKASSNGSDKLIWCGGETHVVQVGDQVDRCRPIGNMTCDLKATTHNDEASDIKILELYTDMHKQAVKVGGAVISLLGNHELMNSLGHMDYVSHEGLKQFKNYRDPKNPNLKFKSGKHARMYAFKPGNEYGKYLACNRLPCVIIGSNIFVHAGIVDGLIGQLGLKGYEDFETINKSVRMWLLGLLKTDYIRQIIDSSKHSMFWTRILGKIHPGVSLKDPICADNIGKVLKLFNVGGIIVGHTPQSFLYDDDINSTCSNSVFRVDNGSSSAFDKFDKKFMKTGNKVFSRRVQWLIILDDKTYFRADGNGKQEKIN